MGHEPVGTVSEVLAMTFRNVRCSTVADCIAPAVYKLQADNRIWHACIAHGAVAESQLQGRGGGSIHAKHAGWREEIPRR